MDFPDSTEPDLPPDFFEDRSEQLATAEDAVIRERSRALGKAVHDLALLHNGVDIEPESDGQRLLEVASELVKSLDLGRYISIKKEAPGVNAAAQADINTWASMIDQHLTDQNLSLRKGASIAGCSHTHLASVRSGTASWQLTRQVALAFGIIDSQEPAQ